MREVVSFVIFISIVIFVYSLLNYYFIKKNKDILTGKSLPVILLRLVIFTLIVAPVATMFFSYKELPFWAAITGFTGYGWLAFLFLFLMIHGIADIILFVVEKIGFVSSGYFAREVLAFTLFFSIGALCYGFYEAENINVERIVIESKKLSSDIKRLRIMQVSDLHFSPIISVDRARKIKEIVDSEKPDILVSTGDFLDRAIRDSEDVATVMKSIQVPLGKYAITGNHEYIAGIEDSVKFIEKSGFTMLRNRGIQISGIINLVGVDDLSAARFGLKSNVSEKDILPDLDQSLYTILLKHQPRIEREVLKYFDLQLSGHTHGGQIFPFTFFVKIVFPYICGKYNLDDNTILYVSRGTGTWGPPVRFLAKPEITVFDLISSP